MAEGIETDSKPDRSQMFPSNSYYPQTATTDSRELYNDIPHYKFAPKAGKYLIFNHSNFEGEGLSRRTGTEYDVNAISQTFDALDFHGQIHNDLGVEQVYETLRETFESDFSDFGSLIVFILTHGDEDAQLHACDGPYKFETVLRYLLSVNMSNSLVGKPKIFIIQACQGIKEDTGVGRGVEKDSQEDGDLLPVHADVLVAYAAPNSFVSFRSTTKGSWFIQTLCDAVNQRSDKDDFETILKMARRRIAVDKQLEAKSKGRKQIPVAVTALTKTFYLTPAAFEYRERR